VVFSCRLILRLKVVYSQFHGNFWIFHDQKSFWCSSESRENVAASDKIAADTFVNTIVAVAHFGGTGEGF